MSSAEATVEGGEVLQLPSARSTDARPRVKPKLYHFPTSLGSQQARLVLAERQLEWEGEIVNTGPADEHYEPAYARLNPLLDVPTLALGDTVVTGTVEIAKYLCEHFEGPRLLPEDPEEREEIERWVALQAQFPMDKLGFARTKGVVRWILRWNLHRERKKLRKHARRNPDLRELYEAKEAELAELDQIIRDRKAMNALVDEVEVLLDEIEDTLEQREWLAGSRYSLADLMWTAVIARLEHIGFARSLADHRRPRVARWYARIRERPSWGAMIRRLSAMQALRFYGPAVAKGFLLFWVLKWALVIGLGWLIAHLSS